MCDAAPAAGSGFFAVGEDLASVLCEAITGTKCENTLNKKDEIDIPAALERYGLAELHGNMIPGQDVVDAIKLRLTKGDKFPHIEWRNRPFYPKKGTVSGSNMIDNDKTVDELLGQHSDRSLTATQAAQDIVAQQAAAIKSCHVPMAQWVWVLIGVYIGLALCGVMGENPAPAILSMVSNIYGYGIAC